MMDLRQTGRCQIQGRVRVHWGDPSGATFGSLGRIQEASATGFSVDMDRHIAIGHVVQIESHDLKVVGLAVVRHCSQKGMGFRLGLQFSGGLRRPQ